MTPLSLSESLSEVDLADSQVRRELAEMLPSTAQSKCSDSGAVPAELIEEVTGGDGTGTIGDLVLELTIMLTDGHFAEEVVIDTSAVELVPAAFDREMSDDPQWARLSFDLSRPDWTVVVGLRALQEASAPGPEGVLCILVQAGLDFRGWLAEERTRAMLHEWYVQYQAAGTLHSDRQLAELHEELTWIEERGRFVFASQLTPQDPAEATWQLQEIRNAGGARAWAGQLWERCDRPAILAADGSWEREGVIGELVTSAERLLALAAEREC